MRRIGLGMLAALAALVLVRGAAAAELTVLVVGEGTTTPGAGVHTFEDGAVVELAAFTVADSGYAFSQWSGDVSTGARSTSITLDGDKTVTAEFVPGDYTLTLTETGAGAGTTDPGPGVHSYLSGQVATVTAQPGTAYFGGWTGAVTSTYPVIELMMDEDLALNADFSTFGRTVNLVAGAGGTTVPAPGSYRYTTDLYIEIEAVVTQPGLKFKNWVGDIEANLVVLPKVSFPVDANRVITAEFEEDEKDWTLFINVVGFGDTSPSVQFLRYDNGETATVTAVSVAGSNHAFANWSGAVNTTGETASVFMNGNKTITATFVTPPEVTLDMSVEGPGTTSPEPGVHGFITGRTAQLRAIPNAGKFFAGWTGDIVGIAPVDSLLMNGNKAVHATFADSGFVLTLQQYGVGSVGLPLGTYAIASGIPVPLTATPEVGHRFVKWEGDLGGADPLSEDLVVTMDRARTVRALFVPENSFYLRIRVNGQGNAAPPAGDYSYVANTNVYLAALPKPGYVFTQWSGDVTEQQAGLKQFFYRMTKDADVTVNFAQAETTLTLIQQGQGELDPAPGTYIFLNTEEATITASNMAGSLFAFARWEGDIGAADPFAPSLTLDMQTDRKVTAVFVPQGEGEIAFQACDQNLDGVVGLSELLRVVQFYNAGGLRCASAPGATEDGYVAGPIGPTTCAPYTSDCAPQDWSISLSELLRTIQFYNALGYYYCPGEATEDGFCPGAPG